jgi:hypothetical protein
MTICKGRVEKCASSVEGVLVGFGLCMQGSDAQNKMYKKGNIACSLYIPYREVGGDS